MLRAEVSIAEGGFGLAAAFSVEPGECLTVTGPSGSGKTTLLRAIAGLVEPLAGSIECGGETWFDRDAGLDVPLPERRIGFVFQECALFPKMSALSNVTFAMADLPRGERVEAARELLEGLGIGGLEGRRPGSLSGGEQQRLAIARAMARRPSLLLLDEPFSSLDEVTGANALEATLRLITRTAIPALLVTHDPTAISHAGARRMVIEDGVARIL